MVAYKKGDRVRIVRTPYSPFVLNGAMGTVSVYEPFAPNYLGVIPDGSTKRWFFTLGEVEPLPRDDSRRYVGRMTDAEWNERRERVYARYCKHEKRVEAGVVYAERYGRTSRFAAAFPRREPRGPVTWTVG